VVCVVLNDEGVDVSEEAAILVYLHVDCDAGAVAVCAHSSD